MPDDAKPVTRTPEIIAADWLAAKKLLKEAQTMLDECSAEIVAALGKKDEGSKTHNLNGFKIEISQPVSRSVDLVELAKIEQSLAGDPAFPSSLIKTKVVTELDEKGFKWYRENAPAVYARLAAAVTAKPGKVGVTIVRTE